MKLSYVVSPQYNHMSLSSLPKILFLSHPSARHRLGECYRLIGDALPSAVFYLDRDAEGEAIDWAEILEKTSLAVVALTLPYFSESDTVRDYLVPMLRKQEIPILFLMLDRNCDAEYQRYYGNLEYLSPYQNAKDGLSYEDKIKRYIRSVVWDSSLQEKVRTAFDARIFLSYRKKDRREALLLAELIHRNPLFRDVAIWYDDYLIPNEDFNDTIRGALKKSDLFVLAVTPHMLEDGNYVMTSEYPDACRENKTVLPFQMIETDREAMKQRFLGLPPFVDVFDEKRLEASVKIALSPRVLLKNDADPEHRYKIGLAYLHGIDVEKSPKLATELLKSAANEGSLAAMETLAEIYEQGMGVSSSRSEALRWYQMLKRALKTLPLTAEWDFDKRVSVDPRIADLLYTEKQYREAEEAFVDLAFAFEKERRFFRAAGAYYRAAKACQAMGKNGDARGHLTSSILLYREHGQKSEALGYANALMLMGKLFVEDGDREALVWMKEACLTREKVFSLDSPIADWQALTESYQAYARAVASFDGEKAAETVFLRAESFFSIADKDAHFSKRDYHYQALATLAKSYTERKCYSEAEARYRKLDALFEKEIDTIVTINDCLSVSWTYQKMAAFYHETDRRLLAEHYYQKSVTFVAERLLKTPSADGSESYFALWVAFEIAGHMQSEGKLRYAEVLCREGLDFCERFRARYGTTNLDSEIEFGYYKLKDILEAKGDDEGALQCLMKACHCELPIPSGEAEPIDWLNYATFLSWRAMNFSSVGDDEKAIHLYEKKLFAMEKFASMADPEHFEDNVRYTRQVLSDHYRYVHRYDEAEKLLKQSYDALTCSEDRYHDHLIRMNLCIALSELYTEAEQYELSERYLVEGEQVMALLTALGDLPPKHRSGYITARSELYHAYVNYLLAIGRVGEAEHRALCSTELWDMGKRALNQTLTAWQDLSEVMLRLARFEDAERALLLAFDELDTAEKDLTHYDEFRVWRRASLYETWGRILCAEGKEHTGKARFHTALELYESVIEKTHGYTAYLKWLDFLSRSLLADDQPDGVLLVEAAERVEKRCRLYPDNPINQRYREILRSFNVLI